MMELFHKLHIQRLQSGQDISNIRLSPYGEQSILVYWCVGINQSPVSTRIDEVETTVHTMVFNVPAVQARLVPQVLIILLIHIVDNGLPATHREWTRQVKLLLLHVLYNTH